MAVHRVGQDQQYGGFAAILLILPVIALVSYTMMAILPVLAIVKMMKIAENATDYSINNTSRHVLWLPISSELKFRAKPAIDTLYVRLGDGLAALTVLVGVQLLSLSTGQFFVFNISLVVLWLIAGIMLVLIYPLSPTLSRRDAYRDVGGRATQEQLPRGG